MVLIVQSLWNQSITDSLVKSAKKYLDQMKMDSEVVQVSGALEIPLAIKWAWSEAQRKQKPLVGAIACGCVVKGETYHFELVAEESSRALMNLSLDLRLPIGHAILAVFDLQQAIERSSEKNNKGAEAAESVVRLIKLKEERGY